MPRVPFMTVTCRGRARRPCAMPSLMVSHKPRPPPPHAGSRGGRPEDDLDPSSAEALEAALATAPPELAQTWREWITQDAAAVAAAGNLEALDQEYFRVMAPAARPSVFGSGSQ